MQTLYFALAFAIGLVLPLQAAINNTLKPVLGGSTLLVALVSFCVGGLVLAGLSLLSAQPFGSLSNLPKVAWWQLLGGTLGAFFVFGTTLLAPRIGLAALMALIVAGQLCSSLLFDRIGVFGLAVRSVAWPQLVGVALVIAGVLLVNFGGRE